MRRQPDQIQQFRNSPLQSFGGHPVQFPVETQEFLCSQPVMETEMFGQETDSLTPHVIAKRQTKQLSLPRSGGDQPQQHFHRCSLAGSIRPQEAENLPTLDRQGEVSYSDFFAENLTQAVNFYRGWHI
jgi:hypothetical protein